MTPSDYDRMMTMITGHWITQIVHAIAKYSLADHLALGPATAADIAKMAGRNPSIGDFSLAEDLRFAGSGDLR